jgi:hypothetical protein
VPTFKTNNDFCIKLDLYQIVQMLISDFNSQIFIMDLQFYLKLIEKSWIHSYIAKVQIRMDLISGVEENARNTCKLPFSLML